MFCCSNHEGKDSNRESHGSGHHGKMMWLMMLLCLAPVLLVFFVDTKISKMAVFLVVLVCVGGHFLIMKLMDKAK